MTHLRTLSLSLPPQLTKEPESFVLLSLPFPRATKPRDMALTLRDPAISGAVLHLTTTARLGAPDPREGAASVPVSE
jgi:hypothetical protein